MRVGRVKQSIKSGNVGRHTAQFVLQTSIKTNAATDHGEEAKADPKLFKPLVAPS